MSDGVEHRKGKILIELDVEGATWLAGELPHNDGFTRDLWVAVKEAEGWIRDDAEWQAQRPRVRVVVVERAIP